MKAPELRHPWQRLRWAREHKGFPSATAFAKAEGVGESTYRHHENGQRQLDVQKARRYGDALGVSWYWLLTGDPLPFEIPQARLFGTVGAGEQIIPHSDGGNHDTVESPPGMATPAAVNVRGESMLPAYRPGDLLFFDLNPDGPRVPTDAIKRDCVVQVHEGPIYVKRLARGAAPDLYTLRSYAAEDIEDQPVDWARPIRWIKRG